MRIFPVRAEFAISAVTVFVFTYNHPVLICSLKRVISVKNHQKNKISVMAQEMVPLKLNLKSVACCCLSSMCFENKQQILLYVSWSSSLLSHPSRLCSVTAQYPSGRFREFWREKGYLSVCFNFAGIDVIISSVISKHGLVLFIAPKLESPC